jgi:hypothetical protein
VLALARYHLALLGHSQRYVPAVLLLLVVWGIQYNGDDANAPLPPQFGVSAGAMAMVACWLTVAVLDVEDPVQRQVTLSHARRTHKVVLGVVLSVLACVAVLSAVSELWAVAIHDGPVGTALAAGAVAHATAGGAGIAIGLPCSRLLVNRVGWTVIAAILSLALVLVASWLPFLHPVLQDLVTDRPAGGALLLGGVTSLLGLATSVGVVSVLTRRRG